MKSKENNYIKLIKTLEEYNQVMLDELNSIGVLAHVHGWKWNKERFEKGKILRDKIKLLKTKI